ncbi:uncharacterized protein SPSC_00006 [Sporisorium scitamineum]|uniref:Uncharacterized protein n=1 Tax=Sporisorium scitamineum TaxID=49012 RepID=A0A140KLV5_9BASI|nr:uncharacterized protein SPSC_00006 [Sporisorium scitamineum]
MQRRIRGLVLPTAVCLWCLVVSLIACHSIAVALWHLPTPCPTNTAELFHPDWKSIVTFLATLTDKLEESPLMQYAAWILLTMLSILIVIYVDYCRCHHTDRKRKQQGQRQPHRQQQQQQRQVVRFVSPTIRWLVSHTASLYFWFHAIDTAPSTKQAVMCFLVLARWMTMLDLIHVALFYLGGHVVARNQPTSTTLKQSGTRLRSSRSRHSKREAV